MLMFCNDLPQLTSSIATRQLFATCTRSGINCGSVPGHVALNLHDSLQLLGFHGWCDVDNLHEISKDGIRAGIAACCCMIVLINDESHLSDWCS